MIVYSSTVTLISNAKLVNVHFSSVIKIIKKKLFFSADEKMI